MPWSRHEFLHEPHRTVPLRTVPSFRTRLRRRSRSRGRTHRASAADSGGRDGPQLRPQSVFVTSLIDDESATYNTSTMTPTKCSMLATMALELTHESHAVMPRGCEDFAGFAPATLLRIRNAVRSMMAIPAPASRPSEQPRRGSLVWCRSASTVRLVGCHKLGAGYTLSGVVLSMRRTAIDECLDDRALAGHERRIEL